MNFKHTHTKEKQISPLTMIPKQEDKLQKDIVRALYNLSVKTRETYNITHQPSYTIL